MDLETLSVSEINKVISKSDYLVSHINTNDKEPSWDGDIEVYTSPGDNHKKTDLLLKVPVQVKGTQKDCLTEGTIQYSVQYSDLENYLHRGGTMFFVVYIDSSGDNSQIYFAEFLPYNIKHFLNNRKEGAKTKNIKFKKFPKGKLAVSELLITFAKNMKRQAASAGIPDISLDEFIKTEIKNTGEIPELRFSVISLQPKGENGNQLNALFNRDMYLYGNTTYGLEIPVLHVDRIEKISVEYKSAISICGKSYNCGYKRERTVDTDTIYIGKSIKIVGNEDMTAKVRFDLAGSLVERIADLDFFLDFWDKQQFEIYGEKYIFGEGMLHETEEFNLLALKKNLSWLKDIRKTLDLLDCYVDLAFEQLQLEDFEKLELLRIAVVEGKTIPVTAEKNAVGFFEIGDLRIYACFFKGDDGRYKVFNFNEESLNIKLEFPDNKGTTICAYELFTREVFADCSNINWKKFVECIQNLPLSDVRLSIVTTTLLNVLNAYDSMSEKNQEMLNSALEIAKWIKVWDDSDISLLNYYQAVKRSRDLTKTEKHEITQIIEKDKDKVDIVVGACLLLGYQDLAEQYFDRLDSDQQEVFR